MTPVFDVAIVGGGAAGCLAAWRLSHAGRSVALLERGGPRSAASGDLAGSATDPGIALLREPDPAWPFESAAGEGCPPFSWLRAFGFGGRLNYWLGTSLRFAPGDFVVPGHPELEWPIGERDLAPYYDQIEGELGCAPAGSPFPADLVDEGFLAAGRACGCRVVAARQSAESPLPTGPDLRFRAFTPLDRWLPRAVETGRCRLFPFAVARRLRARAGRIEAVEAVDGVTGEPLRVQARTVMVAASAIETARLLLESIAEGSLSAGAGGGLVGQRLMDHVFARETFTVPIPKACFPSSRAFQTCYIPCWPGGGPQRVPPSEFHVQIFARELPGLGERLGDLQNRYLLVDLIAIGEALPIAGNGVVLSPGGERDRYGNRIPLLHFRWDEAHRDLHRRMSDALAELISNLPWDCLRLSDQRPGPVMPLETGGHAHEVGTCPMGRDEGRAVTSPGCAVYGVENLFLVDGSTFISCPHPNPTLTILANCARVCDGILHP